MEDILNAALLPAFITAVGCGIFFGTIHVIWGMIDCLRNPERSGTAKAIWALFMFLTWGGGNIVYGLFAAKGAFAKVTRVAFVLLLLGVGLVVGAVYKLAQSKGTEQLVNELLVQLIGEEALEELDVQLVSHQPAADLPASDFSLDDHLQAIDEQLPPELDIADDDLLAWQNGSPDDVVEPTGTGSFFAATQRALLQAAEETAASVAADDQTREADQLIGDPAASAASLEKSVDSAAISQPAAETVEALAKVPVLPALESDVTRSPASVAESSHDTPSVDVPSPGVIEGESPATETRALAALTPAVTTTVPELSSDNKWFDALTRGTFNVGSSVDSVRAALGEPEEEITAGDETRLVYSTNVDNVLNGYVFELISVQDLTADVLQPLQFVELDLDMDVWKIGFRSLDHEQETVRLFCNGGTPQDWTHRLTVTRWFHLAKRGETAATYYDQELETLRQASPDIQSELIAEDANSLTFSWTLDDGHQQITRVLGGTRDIYVIAFEATGDADPNWQEVVASAALQ